MLKNNKSKIDDSSVKGVVDFEIQTLEITLFVGSLVSLFSTIGNFFLDLNAQLILTTAIGTVIYSFLYVFYRLFGVNEWLKWITTIASLILLDFIWVYNHGYDGPILYIYLIFIIFLAFVWDKKQLFILMTFVAINIPTFYYIDVYHPELIPVYDSEIARMLDVNIGFGIAVFSVFIYIFYAKRSLQEETRKAKMSDDLKTRFLLNMSHEIRTPLNVISGYSSVIANEDITPEERKKFSQYISSNSVYLSRLVDDIIDLSRIETNQLLIEKEYIDLYDFFDEQRSRFYEELDMLNYRTISLEFEYPPVDIIINTDRVRLNQIIRNLFSNAVKYTDVGVVSFGCEVKDLEVVFYMKDMGKGIKEENFDFIFQRFTKIEDDEQSVVRGAGLGLFLVKNMIAELNGRVWVESEYGKGSVFYFTIPYIHDNLVFEKYMK